MAACFAQKQSITNKPKCKTKRKAKLKATAPANNVTTQRNRYPQVENEKTTPNLSSENVAFVAFVSNNFPLNRYPQLSQLFL